MKFSTVDKEPYKFMTKSRWQKWFKRRYHPVNLGVCVCVCFESQYKGDHLFSVRRSLVKKNVLSTFDEQVTSSQREGRYRQSTTRQQNAVTVLHYSFVRSGVGLVFASLDAFCSVRPHRY